jgi:hypothetical protein
MKSAATQQKRGTETRRGCETEFFIRLHSLEESEKLVDSFLDTAVGGRPESGAGAHALQDLSEQLSLPCNAERLGVRNASFALALALL